MLPLVETVIAFIVVILLASLLVTALTQVIVAGFNLRGRNLVWGLERLFTSLRAPQAVARQLARSVACHELLTNSDRPPWCYAKVVRVEELKAVLCTLARERGDAQELNPAAKWLREEVLNRPLPQARSGGSLRNEVLRALHDYQDRLEGVARWFDVLSDRMSERFAFNSRLCSVACAVAVTLVLQLDALDVLQRMASNEPLRRQAVAVAEKAQAAQLGLEGGNIFEEAFTAATADCNATFPAHQPFFSRGQGEAWITTHVPPGMDGQVLAERYRQAVNNAARSSMERNVVKAAELLDQLDALGVNLMAWRKKPWDWRAIPGMAMSVVLLSLGAPFWYNLLGQLLSLRSKIMGKEEEERKGRAGAARP